MCRIPAIHVPPCGCADAVAAAIGARAVATKDAVDELRSTSTRDELVEVLRDRSATSSTTSS